MTEHWGCLSEVDEFILRQKIIVFGSCSVFVVYFDIVPLLTSIAESDHTLPLTCNDMNHYHCTLWIMITVCYGSSLQFR